MNQYPSDIFSCPSRFLPVLAIGLLLAGCGGTPDPGPPPPPGPGIRVTGIDSAGGMVSGFRGNAAGDIDLLILRSGDDSIAYHFPPHMAEAVMQVAVKNRMVFVRSALRTKGRADDGSGRELLSVRSPDLQREINLRHMPPPPPRPGSAILLEGRPEHFREAPGRFFVLAGHRIVLSPRAAETLLPLLAGSHHVIVRGEQRDSSEGFVSADGLPPVRAKQITIDSIHYIID